MSFSCKTLLDGFIMCKWGNTVDVRVKVPADLSHTGKTRFAIKPIDSCLARDVRLLNFCGIYTRASCCGHGKAKGEIMLWDGKVIKFKKNKGIKKGKSLDENT